MAEYVEKEALKRAIRKVFHDLGMRIDINSVINIQPTADVVEVVWCKYCKHYDMFPNESNGTCQKNVDSRVSFYPWSFCSYGERRTYEQIR